MRARIRSRANSASAATPAASRCASANRWRSNRLPDRGFIQRLARQIQANHAVPALCAATPRAKPARTAAGPVRKSKSGRFSRWSSLHHQYSCPRRNSISVIIEGWATGERTERMAISAGNSFGTRDTLRLARKASKFIAWRCWRKMASPTCASCPFLCAFLLENLLRFEDGRFVHAADIRSPGRLAAGHARKRNCLHARARAAAGFHRRARRRRSRRHARSDADAWAAIPSASIRCSPPNW